MPRKRAVFVDAGRQFDIGRHLLRLEEAADGWTASVDGIPLGGTFAGDLEAWAAGVRAAQQLDLGAPLQAPVAAPLRRADLEARRRLRRRGGRPEP